MARIKLDTTKIESVTRQVTLEGAKDLMLDRYAGDNNTRLEWYQKLYFDLDGETLVLPALNIMSFLSAHNTNSAPKRLKDKRKFKDFCNACLSYIDINPQRIPITRDGQPIKFGRIQGEADPKSGVYLHRAVARLDKGIPNPKERPVIPTPWAISFALTITPNSEIQEQEVINIFDGGGIAIGLGTFRGVFGKFKVTQWD